MLCVLVVALASGIFCVKCRCEVGNDRLAFHAWQPSQRRYLAATRHRRDRLHRAKPKGLS